MLGVIASKLLNKRKSPAVADKFVTMLVNFRIRFFPQCRKNIVPLFDLHFFNFRRKHASHKRGRRRSAGKLCRDYL